MNKTDFLNELYTYLGPVKHHRKSEIINYYRGIFDEGSRRGKSEAQVCAELGNPAELARQYLNEAGDTGNLKKEGKLNKPIWTAALFFNIAEAVISVPLILLLLILDIILIVVAVKTVPVINFAAFTVFMVSLMAGIFILILIFLLINIFEIREIVKQIKKRNEGKSI